MEEKIIDQIIEILSLMNQYTPTPQLPANPALPIIRIKMLQLQTTRKAAVAKFKINFINIAEITKEISSIKLS